MLNLDSILMAHAHKKGFRKVAMVDWMRADCAWQQILKPGETQQQDIAQGPASALTQMLDVCHALSKMQNLWNVRSHLKPMSVHHLSDV